MFISILYEMTDNLVEKNQVRNVSNHGGYWSLTPYWFYLMD